MTRRHAATTACPFCGGPGTRMLDAWDRNRESTQERFTYARCRSCGTVYIVDPPADLGRYYAEDYYQFAPDGEPAWKTDEARLRAAAHRVDLMRSHTAPGRLIEIGAGTGAFASAAQSAGYEVSAIEMSERCCRYRRRRVSSSPGRARRRCRRSTGAGRIPGKVRIRRCILGT